MQEEHGWEVESTDDWGHKEDSMSPQLGILVNSLFLSIHLLNQESNQTDSFVNHLNYLCWQFAFPSWNSFRIFYRSISFSLPFDCLLLSSFNLDLDCHRTKISFFVFFCLLISYSCISLFSFFFCSFFSSVDCFWILPKSELVPIEDEENGEDEL